MKVCRAGRTNSIRLQEHSLSLSRQPVAMETSLFVVCESLSLLYDCPSIAPHFPLGHSPYNICPSQVPAPHALRASPMKARSLTPAERVRGHPPSTHTLMLLCLTAARRHPVVTPWFVFVHPLEQNFPLGMTKSATNNSKLSFSGSFRWFPICLNIRGTASYGQQPSRPHYTCNLCSRFQEVQAKLQSTENSINHSKKKSLK